MPESLISAAIASVATLLGVTLGAWLTSRRESQAAQRGLLNQRRAERRDVYVRFLAAADRAFQQALETGRKRTTVHSREEGRQHFLDWVAARDDLRLHLTELSLTAPPEVLDQAIQVVLCATEFGEESLLAGTEGGMQKPPAEHRKIYAERQGKLVATMKVDLDLTYGLPDYPSLASDPAVLP